jgi:hypothetical protein
MSSNKDTASSSKSIDESVADLLRELPACPDTEDCGHCGGELEQTDRGVVCTECKARSHGPHWVWQVPVRSQDHDDGVEAYKCAVCGVRVEGHRVVIAGDLHNRRCDE